MVLIFAASLSDEMHECGVDNCGHLKKDQQWKILLLLEKCIKDYTHFETFSVNV